MVGSVIRSALLAGIMSAVGPRAAEQIERRLGGKRAMAARAHIAHRSLMALLFREMKSTHKATKPRLVRNP